MGSADALTSTRYVVSHWGVTEGLPQTSVTAIAEDERGFIWVTTFGGLARFDGLHFTRVDLPYGDLDGHRFVSVACTGSTIWAGTDHGRLFRFENFGQAPPREVTLGIKRAEPVWQLLPLPNGHVLVAAGSVGLLEVAGEVVTNRGAPFDVVLVDTGANGAVWVASAEQATCLAAGCVKHTVKSPMALSARADGSVLVFGRDGVFSLGEHTIERVSSHGGPAFDDVAGRWSVDEGGLTLTETTGQVHLELGVGVGQRRVPPPSVRGFFKDSLGSLWVRTNDAGLFRVSDRGVKTIDAAAGLGGSSVDLVLPLPSGGALVGAYCHGLQRLTGDHQVTPVAGIAGDGCVTALTNDGASGAWVAVTHVLSHFDGKEVTQTPVEGLVSGDIKVILRDGPSMWLGTTTGLLRLEPRGNGFRVVRTWGEQEGLVDQSVYSLAIDQRGALLIGTLRGAMRLKGGELKVLTTEFNATVRDFLLEGDSGVWLATYGEGLARLDIEGAEPARWFVKAQGFCSDELSRMVRVGDDVWFNTNQGVFMLTMSELRALATAQAPPRCRIVEAGEGNGGGQLAGGVLADGVLAFPTVEGIALIDPLEMKTRKGAPLLYVEQATVDGRPLVLGAANVIEPGRRDLTVALMTPPDGWSSHEPRDVEMTLTRDGIERRTRLGGLSAAYLDLAPGDYVFEARRQGGSAVKLTFRLERALFERPLIRFGAPIMLMTLIALYLRAWARGRSLELERQLRAREVTERARKERDELYRAAFDGSPGPLFLFDARGILYDVNLAASRLMHWATLTLPTNGLGFVADEDHAAFLAVLAAPTLATHTEVTLQTRPTERRRIRIDAAQLEIAGQRRVLVAATDMTLAREAEAQREALLTRDANAQRLEGLGRLAAGVAHDFNNVLAALQLHVSDLRARSDDAHVVKSLADEMDEALRIGRDFTARFLVFGKGEPEPTTFAIDEAVRSARALLTRLMPADVELTFDCAAPRIGVRLPRVHLERLLLNLVLNARDALGGKGRITVRTSVEAAPMGSECSVILPAPTGAVVRLEVIDTGCGMTPDVVSRAFEPFFTTRGSTHGTGLGLSVVHGIAQRAGSGLAVESAVNRGTRFCLSLPVVELPIELTTASAAETSTPAHPRTVLVCDDTVPLRRALARLLRRGGMRVLEAPDGAQALAQARATHIDLIITDLVMPELDGGALVSTLRTEGATMPIIVLSGYTPDAAARVRQWPDVVVMQKPFVPEELLSRVRRLTQPSGAEDGATAPVVE